LAGTILQVFYIQTFVRTIERYFPIFLQTEKVKSRHRGLRYSLLFQHCATLSGCAYFLVKTEKAPVSGAFSYILDLFS